MDDSKITILVADYYAIVRKGICSLLNSVENFNIIGEATDSVETGEKTERLLPNVIVVDEYLLGIDSIESVRLIRKKAQNTKIIILTMQKSNGFYLRQILQNKADGFVSKASAETELVSAILAVYNKKVYLCPIFTQAAIDDVSHNISEHLENYEKLTSRERKVIGLVAEGFCNKEIAHNLCVSVSTVKNQKSSIFRKLGVRDSPGLMKYCYKVGIVRP